LKPFTLTFSELAACNAQKFGRHVTLATTLFEKKLRGHVRTATGNGTCTADLKSAAITVLKLLSFNVVAHRQTRTHKHIRWKPYLRRSLRSLDWDNWKSLFTTNGRFEK